MLRVQDDRGMVVYLRAADKDKSLNKFPGTETCGIMSTHKITYFCSIPLNGINRNF
jgi:hypothetical protein